MCCGLHWRVIRSQWCLISFLSFNRDPSSSSTLETSFHFSRDKGYFHFLVNFVFHPTHENVAIRTPSATLSMTIQNSSWSWLFSRLQDSCSPLISKVRAMETMAKTPPFSDLNKWQVPFQSPSHRHCLPLSKIKNEVFHQVPNPTFPFPVSGLSQACFPVLYASTSRSKILKYSSSRSVE